MFKIAICDDEKVFLNKEERLVKKFFDAKKMECLVSVCQTGKELFEINISDYDIVFLDINLEDMNGMDIAIRIRELNKKIFIVFITSIIDYALQGYKVDAIRYILKNDMDVMIFECLDTIIKKNDFYKYTYKIIFAGEEKTLFIDDILLIESFGRKLFFRLVQNKEEENSMYGKLDEVEKELSKYGFIRIQKSYLVNAKYIKSINSSEISLVNGLELKIGRIKYTDVKEKYLEYKGDMW